MTVNFKNSAGTDLDSLFYTDNSNAGAIGFLTGGVDLGNKYTAASTLGYNVGYTNAAGTDLGYLRGNLAKPEGAVVSLDKVSGKACKTTSTDTSGETTTTTTDYHVGAVMKLTINSPVPYTTAHIVIKTTYCYMGFDHKHKGGFYPNDSTLRCTNHATSATFKGARTYYTGDITGNEFVYSYASTTTRHYHTYFTWQADVTLTNDAGSVTYTAVRQMNYDSGHYS